MGIDGGKNGKEMSQALELPENIKKEKKGKKGKRSAKDKNEDEDPSKPTPYAPFGLGPDGKPITSIDDPNFNMSYYHPDMEVNFCNPENDPNIQISSNNKHNNPIEDYSTRGKYYQLDFKDDEIKLDNLNRSLETKEII